MLEFILLNGFFCVFIHRLVRWMFTFDFNVYLSIYLSMDRSIDWSIRMESKSCLKWLGKFTMYLNFYYPIFCSSICYEKKKWNKWMNGKLTFGKYPIFGLFAQAKNCLSLSLSSSFFFAFGIENGGLKSFAIENQKMCTSILF